MNKKLLSVTLSGLMLVGIGGVASAATVNAQGGTWNYGVGKKYVYSNYSHNSKAHGSTAVGKYTSSSGKIRAGVQAKASAEKRYRVNNSYYKVY